MSSTPTVIVWAESPPSGRTAIVAPSAQRQAEGWVENRPLSAEEINWLWNAVGGVTQRVAKFATQEDAAETLSEGMSCILDEDSEGEPFAQEGFSVAGGTAEGRIDVDSRYVYITAGAFAERFDRAPSGSTVPPSGRTQYSPSPSGSTARAVVTDGTTVFLAVDDRVVAFDAATASQLWDYDHGAAVHDLALVDDTRVAMCGALGTGNYHVRMLSKSGGAVSGSYQHHSTAGVVYAIASNGRQIFIAGDASDYTSGATIRGLRNVGGLFRAATTEGGATATTSGMAWDDARFGTTVRHAALACDRRRLAVLHPESALVQVELRCAADGTVLQTREIAEEPRGVAMDHSYVYVSCSDSLSTTPTGFVEVYALPDLAYCHRIYSDGSGYTTGDPDEGVFGVASDGTAVFAREVLHGVVTRHRVPAGARLWARVDATDRTQPPFQQLIPTWGT